MKRDVVDIYADNKMYTTSNIKKIFITFYQNKKVKKKLSVLGMAQWMVCLHTTMSTLV